MFFCKTNWIFKKGRLLVRFIPKKQFIIGLKNISKFNEINRNYADGSPSITITM